MAAAPLSGQVPEWRLLPVWRLGDADRENYDLSQIAGLAVDRSGRIYIGQPQEGAVRIYDANGQFVGRIGSRGRGPGEFESIADVFVRGTSIYVLDLALLRLSKFDSTELIKQWSSADLIDPALRRAPPQELLGSNLATSIAKDSITLEIYTANSSAATRLAAVSHQGRNATIRAGKMKMSVPRPVSWRGFWEVASSGEHVTLVSQPEASPGPAHFSVVRLTPTGDTVFSARYRYVATRSTAARWDSIVAARANAALSVATKLGASTAELREALYQAFGPPATIPPVEAVVVASDGTTWLRLSDGTADALDVWMVLDGSGKTAAKLNLPEAWEVVAVEGEFVYIVTTGDYDLPLIIKARVARR